MPRRKTDLPLYFGSTPQITHIQKKGKNEWFSLHIGPPQYVHMTGVLYVHVHTLYRNSLIFLHLRNCFKTTPHTYLHTHTHMERVNKISIFHETIDVSDDGDRYEREKEREREPS